jgi:hypothetical protein
MGYVFYVKTMDGKESILKKEEVGDISGVRIDTFYLPHDVLVWHTTVTWVTPAPWDNVTVATQKRIWQLYRHVKGIWMLKKHDEVPGILRMMELTGAL